MQDIEDRNGVVARITHGKNVWRAIALIIVFTFLVLFLDTRTQLPSFNWLGAAADLAKDAGAEIVVLLIGFLVVHWFLRHEQEILSRSEVDRIGSKVAHHVAEVVRTPPLDDTLLDPRNNAHILSLADEEVCISRETGNSLFEECHLQMKTMLNDGYRFRIVLTEPGTRGAEHTSFRRSNSGKSDLAARQKIARNLLTRIFGAGVKARQRVEIRYTAFALPATVIITDPDGRRSEIMYRQVGHLNTEERERFSLRLDSVSSPRSARLIIGEFDRIFHAASKTVVIPRDERLERFGWPELFPGFFQTGWADRRGDGQGEPFVQFAEAGRVFLVAFEAEKDDLLVKAGNEVRYKVWFGSANKRGREVDYAVARGGKWSISVDGLMELHAAFDEAVRSGHIIVVTNLGPVALAMEECCETTDLGEQDLRPSTPEENREFYLLHRDPVTRRMRLSLTPAIESMLDCQHGHLYLHFQRPELTRRSPFYNRLEDHERTTVLDPSSIMDRLPLELQGSATAVAHAVAIE